jgi:uncharacterized protein YkwD
MMPKLFSRLAATSLFLALAACAAVYEVPQEPALTRSLATPGAQVDPLVAAGMISEYRAANGLGPVVVDPVLQGLAVEQARAMAERQKVGHDVGVGPLDTRAARAGYAYDRIAENVAAGYHSLAEAFSGWRDSGEHRRNMLMKEATHIGVAVAQAPGSKYRVYWSMVVAKPHVPGQR